MNQVGSTKDIVSQSITGVTDDLGNSVVSTSTGFGGSPLGVSARAQALYGIANPNFNLTPPNPDSPIEDQSNPLPFWTIDNGSDGEMTATSVFDDTTQTFGIELNPGTAAIDSTLTLTTRSYLLTDDNLALRQRALSVLSKSGTAAGTTEWNLTLTAIYYDATATALSTAVIGTALDTGTWTSISGTTTPGGSAISSSAQYVDLSFKMTATAAVTGSAKATIKSLLLTTSTPGGGGSQSFLVAETFTSSGDWTRPTGVDYLTAVVLVSGGGGGAGGSISDDFLSTAGTSVGMAGGGGGGGGFFAIARDLYVGDAGTWTVTVGAGGSGGTARTKVKASGSANPTYGASQTLIGGLGSNGGATSFGTYITLAGGTGGSASGSAGNSNTLGSAFGAGGTAGSVSTNLIFGIGTAAGGGGGRGGVGWHIVGGTTFSQTAGTPGFAGMTSTLKVFPYIEVLPAAGNAGSTSSGTISAGGTAYSGTAGSGGVSGIGGGGGGAGGIRVQVPNTVTRMVGGVGGSGGGGGAGANLTFTGGDSNASLSGTAGDGGNAGSAGAGGGGAGGGILARYPSTYTSLSLTYKSGAGGNGGGGFVIIVYVG
jgi:hypothetical protein